MGVVDDLKAETIDKQVGSNIQEASLIKTDNYTWYANLEKQVWIHQAEMVKPRNAA